MNQPLQYQKLREILNAQNLISQKLEPDVVERYPSVLIYLQQYLRTIQISQTLLKHRVAIAMRIIKEENPELSINFVLKKLIFLQFFIRWACQNMCLGQEVNQVLQKEVKNIIKEDLEKLSKSKKKQHTSLDKITIFFRQLSVQKSKKTSKMKLQQFDEKQTVKNIVKNIIEPYCCYLLKILNDHEAYRDILINAQQTYSEDFMWKLINWNSILSKIILQLHKIGRYFGQDFIGVWVVCCFIISKDESVFYSILKQNIENKSSKWLQKLTIANRFYQINKKSFASKLMDIFTNDELQQILILKKQIDETYKIKEQLNFLYINNCLKRWRHIMKSIPLNVVALNQQKNSSSDQLLTFIGTLGKRKEFSFIQSDQKLNGSSLISKKMSEKSLQTSEQLKTVNSKDQLMSKANLSLKQKEINPQNKGQVRRNNVFTQKRNRILGRV